MKRLLCFMLCVLGIQAGAQNLVVNGEFQAGTLAPWIGGELRSDQAGNVFARVDESIGQSVTTVVGQRYLLSADMWREDQFGVEVLMIAQASDGVFDVSRTAGVGGTFPRRFTAAFTASTTTTAIRFEITTQLDIILVDNVSLIAVPPTTADGAYGGTIVTTVAVADPPMSMKSSRKVTARLNEDGEIILLDGTEGIITGYILPSGEFALDLPGGKTVKGTGVLRGRRIELEYTVGSHDAVTVAGASVVNTIKQKLTLVRR